MREKFHKTLSLYSYNNIILTNSIRVRVFSFKTLKSSLSFFHILKPQTSARNSYSRKIFTSNKTIRGEKRSRSKRKTCYRSPWISSYRDIATDSDFCRRARAFVLSRARSWCPFNAMPDGNKPRKLVGGIWPKKRRHRIYAGLYYRVGC